MPRTRRGYEYPDGTYPVRTHGDIEALASSVDADVTQVRADALAAAGSAAAAAVTAQARADDAFARSGARIAVTNANPVSVGSGNAWRSVSMDTQGASDGMRQSVQTDPNARSKIRFNRSGLWVVVARAVWEATPSGQTPTGIREAVIGFNRNSSLTDAGAISTNNRGTAADPEGKGTLLAVVTAATGDHVELFVRQTQGVNVALSAGDGRSGTYLAAYWVCPV